jgi:hypothetical protein
MNAKRLLSKPKTTPAGPQTTIPDNLKIKMIFRKVFKK